MTASNGLSRLKNTNRKNFLLLCLPFLATAFMLTVIQVPVGWSALAWVSLVPFVLISSPAARPRPLAIAAYLVGLAYWLGNLYWILPITIIGWAALCLYTAVLWPIIALSLRYCRKKHIPLLLAAPVLFVGAERLQGFLLGGFFWRFLAHSQYANTTLIQIADIFGTAGVSFLVAMVNALVADWILAAGRKRLFEPANWLKTAVVCAALLSCVCYGRWRINQSDKSIETGPLLACCQSNVPQSVKRTFEASDSIFQELLDDSKQTAKTNAELIIWPETMVQAPLNKEIWPFLPPGKQLEDCEVYDKVLSDHARDTAYLLVGAYGASVRQRPDGTPYRANYNSAFLYNPNGRQAPNHYDKIHLVLFGEFIPFRKRLPWLFKILMKFTPYNYDYTLEPGAEYTIFQMAGRDNEKYDFGVMICYEDTVPAIARSFAVNAQGQKQVHWLVNISNDGWFVRFRDKNVLPSTELTQHTVVCAFRAVENRLAIVRSVNTGISCLIDPLGRIRDGFVAGSLPQEAFKRQGTAGWFADKVPIDKRVTFFSKHGQWLDFCCALCLILLVIVPNTTTFIRARRKRNPSLARHRRARRRK